MRPLAALLALAVPALAPAQVITSTWNGASGNWLDPALWAPAVPNNGTPPGATYNAVVNGTSGVIQVTSRINVQQLDFRGGTVAGNWGVSANGPSSWTGGAFASGVSISMFGGLSISGAAQKINANSGLYLYGSSTWSSGTITLYNSAVLVVEDGSTLTAAGDDPIAELGGGTATPLVVNYGTFRKQGGGGATEIRTRYFNIGRTEVNTGRLVLPDGQNGHNATLAVAAGATLEFAPAGEFYFFGGRVSGSGDVAFTRGTTRLDAEYTVGGQTTVNGGLVNVVRDTSVANLAVLSGTVGGTGTVTVAGPLTWAGGGFDGGGSVRAAAGAALVAPVIANERLSVGQKTVTLAGPGSVWSGGTIALGRGALLVNAPGSVLTVTGDNELLFLNQGGPAPRFVNEGTLRKTGSAGTSMFTIPFGGFAHVSNTGTLDVQSGTLAITAAPPTGATVLSNAGTVRVAAGAALTGQQVANNPGAVVTGEGTIANPIFFNAGSALSPGASPGRLTMTGPVTMYSGSALSLELNGSTPGNAANNHDQLSLAGGGSITLGGATLSTSLGYAPAPPDALTIITGGSVSGTFAGLPDLARFSVGTFTGTEYHATIDYTGSSVVLFNITPVPEPSTLLLCSAAAAGWLWRRRRAVA